MSYVSVGQERDFTPDKTIDVNTDAAWPIIHNLHEPVFPYFVPYDPWFGLFDTPHEMYDGHRGELWGSVTIDGTMRVKKHATAAIAVLVGAVACLSDGQFKIYDSSFYISKEKGYLGTLSEMEATMYKICYRFEPLLLVNR